MSPQKRIHLIISGRVQGVGFRNAVYLKARKLDLKGWVRNLADGRVEIVAEGQEENIQPFISWVARGPKAAVVEKVETRPERYQKVIYEKFYKKSGFF